MSTSGDRVISILRQAEVEGILSLHPATDATTHGRFPGWLQTILATVSGFDDEWIDVEFRRPAFECDSANDDWPLREIGSLGVRGACWLAEVATNGDWSGIWYRSDDVYLFVTRSLYDWLELLIANRRYVRLVSRSQAENSYFLLEDQLDKAAADIPLDNSHLPTLRQWSDFAPGVPAPAVAGRGWRIADFRHDASSRGFCVRGRQRVVSLGEANVFAIRRPLLPHVIRVVVAPFVWWAKLIVAGMCFCLMFLVVLSVVAAIVWAAQQFVELLAWLFQSL